MGNEDSPWKFDLNRVFGEIKVSSVLKDMIYIILFLFVFIAVLSIAKVSTWIIAVSFLILIAILVFFAYCYNYLMHKKPDLLRSETYLLNKQKLEMMGNKNNELTAQVIEALPVIEKPQEHNRKQIKNRSRKGTK